MIRKVIISLACVLAATGSASAGAIGGVFGCLNTAYVARPLTGSFVFGVGIADATSFHGAFEYGVAKYFEGRVKLGIADGGGDAEIVFGADGQYQLLDAGKANAPFDLAMGGLLEYADFGVVSVFQIGGTITGSYPFVLSNRSVLSPYARFNARIESVSIDIDDVGNADGSDLRVGLNGGVRWEASKVVNLYGEFQIDGNDGIFLGVEVGVI